METEIDLQSIKNIIVEIDDKLHDIICHFGSPHYLTITLLKYVFKMLHGAEVAVVVVSLHPGSLLRLTTW